MRHATDKPARQIADLEEERAVLNRKSAAGVVPARNYR